MKDKPIAVLGGGNGGHVMAADLTLAGYDVHLYETPLFAEGFRATLERGEVELSGIGRQGVARLRKVTSNMEEAIGEVDLINIVIPATGHELFFKEMIPHLKDGQVVVVWSGRFGSLILAHLLKESSPERRVTIVEANTLPYGARMLGPARARHLLTARRVLVAALPRRDNDRALTFLKSLYPMAEPAKNVLAAAFSNSALITFPPGALLNTGRIEYSGGEFYMFKEGITKAVARVIKGVYEEMGATARGLGFNLPTYKDEDFNPPASLEAVEFEAPTDTLREFAAMRGPTAVPHRYFNENIGRGLVPISGLAKKVGGATPLVDSIITLGSVVCAEDFWQTGRTLEKLGLASMEKEEILRFVDH